MSHRGWTSTTSAHRLGFHRLTSPPPAGTCSLSGWASTRSLRVATPQELNSMASISSTQPLTPGADVYLSDEWVSACCVCMRVCSCAYECVCVRACACIHVHVSAYIRMLIVSQQAYGLGEHHAPRPLSAIAAAGTKVLIAGSPAGHTPLVDIYDVNTNAWTVGTLRSGRSQLAGAGTGNKVCVCVCVCSSCLSCAVFACGGANHLVYASWSLVTSLLGVVWWWPERHCYPCRC